MFWPTLRTVTRVTGDPVLTVGTTKKLPQAATRTTTRHQTAGEPGTRPRAGCLDMNRAFLNRDPGHPRDS